MPYEAYAATGQTYLDGVYGAGAPGLAPGAQAGISLPGAQPQPQQPQQPQPAPSFQHMASVRLDPSGLPVHGAAPSASSAPALVPPLPLPEGGARGGPAPLAQGVQPPPPYFDVSGTVWAEGSAGGDLVPARSIQVCVFHYEPARARFLMSTAAGGPGSACTFTDNNGTYRVRDIVNGDLFDSSAADPRPVVHSRGPDGP